MNWIDVASIIFIVFFIYQGWQSGLLHQLIQAASYICSFFLAITYAETVGEFTGSKLGLPTVWRSIFGFFILAIILEAVLIEVFSLITFILPVALLKSSANKTLGVVASFLKSIILLTVLFIVILALPLRGSIQEDINSSFTGTLLVQAVESTFGDISSKLRSKARQAVDFLTVKTDSDERVLLNLPPLTDVYTNRLQEQEMLYLVNSERRKEGMNPLVVDPDLVAVAREHSKDMFIHRYFSHVNLQNDNVKDRVEDKNISFLVVGENLAYAPNAEVAHEGLMNSPDHKQNILDPAFSRLGIGAIDSQFYGIMFTQVFAD